MASPYILFPRAIGSVLLLLAALLLLPPPAALAQNNSYASMVQLTSTYQANLTQQMINNLASRPGGFGAGGGPPTCLPPPDLMRGMDAHVPPELQGDPRYQEYVRCVRQGGRDAAPTPLMPAQAAGQHSPTMPAQAAGQHLPIMATDFVPTQPGHPAIDRVIAGMALTPQQRVQLRQGADEALRRVATRYRGNNLAVSVTVAYTTAMAALKGTEMSAQQTRELVFTVNDTLGRHPMFAQMSALQKQNESDLLIFQSLVITVLSEKGQRDPQAREHAKQLARAVLKQLNVAT